MSELQKKETFAESNDTLMTGQDDQDSNPFDIFNNPQIKQAKASLPPEMVEQYEQIGKNIWNQMERSESILTANGENVDFTGQGLPPPVEEAAAHISEALKSGMHASLLDEDEKNVMKECFGDQWYTKWGWTDEDMTNGI